MGLTFPEPDEPYPTVPVEERKQARSTNRVDLSDLATLVYPDDLRQLITDPESTAPAIPYNRPEGRLAWLKPWMLNPVDSYPFVEWDDLDISQRQWVVSERIGWAMGENVDTFGTLDDSIPPWIAERVREMDLTSDDQWECAKVAATILYSAYRRDRVLKASKDIIQPANAGHLMAEGNVLARVKGMMQDRSGYLRKVQFDEPVNAYTMLYGDKIAKGGDMLTACTVEDTEEHEITTAYGTIKKVYRARAVSL